MAPSQPPVEEEWTKKKLQTEYRTWDSGSDNDVLNGHIGQGISVTDRGSSDGWNPPRRGAKGGN